jgi:hypothetical protein
MKFKLKTELLQAHCAFFVGRRNAWCIACVSFFKGNTTHYRFNFSNWLVVKS